jgi:hypothetical protein
MYVYACKKCGELNHLTPHTSWNITDFGAKCEKCETINTITLEEGELKKQGIVKIYCLVYYKLFVCLLLIFFAPTYHFCLPVTY